MWIKIELQKNKVWENVETNISNIPNIPQASFFTGYVLDMFA